MTMLLRRLIRRVRESLFTVPTAIIAGCVGAAAFTLWVDSRFGPAIEDWPIVLGTTVGGGRAIATTVAGATITVAAIVFSITALSTQMASSQYSPRAMGGFFEDPLQQAIIGLVVGTFTYSLLILGSMGHAIVDAEATPSVSVTFAVLLGVSSAIGIVAYINHSLKRMQVDSVVRRIADAAMRAVDRHLDRAEPEEPPEGSPPHGEPRPVTAAESGWVVDIHPQLLIELLPPATTARVDVRIGEAVADGDRILTLWPDPGENRGLVEKVRRVVVTDYERSLETDPTFGIRQLVDIALRALSPGVNDPTTAVDVIHHLKTPIREVLMSSAPRRVYSGPGERRVFLTETPSRTEYVHLAFSEIRLAATGQPFVLRALIEVLGDLERELEGVGLSGRLAAVDQELELTYQAARESGLPKPDLQRVLGDLSED